MMAVSGFSTAPRHYPKFPKRRIDPDAIGQEPPSQKWATTIGGEAGVVAGEPRAQVAPERDDGAPVRGSAAARSLIPSRQARRTFRYSSTVCMPPPSPSPRRAQVAEFRSARSETIRRYRGLISHRRSHMNAQGVQLELGQAGDNSIRLTIPRRSALLVDAR